MTPSPIKILYIGDSGSGKTGSQASLALAGYQLRILDFDNGSEILRSLLPAEIFAERVRIKSFTDQMVGKQIPILGKSGTVSGYMYRAVPKRADAYQKAIQALDDWKDQEQSLGGIYSWGPDIVLSFDSLTHLWKAAMRFVLQINNHAGQHPSQPEWGTCQSLVEDILAMLFDPAVQCNVIVTAHITYDKDQNEVLRGLPSGPGKALNSVIGTYFNHTLRAVTRGTQHSILTQSDGVVELKTAAPGKVKSQYPIETGLADYFRDLGRQPPEETKK